MHPTSHAHAVPPRRLRIGRRRTPNRPVPSPRSTAEVRPAPTPTAETRNRQSSERWQLGLIVGAIVLIGTLWTIGDNSDLSAIAELPREERAALFERALTDVRELCRDPAPAAARHCAHQAELLAALPECTGDCRELVTRWLPRATR
jgi:hypothetical protein